MEADSDSVFEEPPRPPPGIVLTVEGGRATSSPSRSPSGGSRRGRRELPPPSPSGVSRSQSVRAARRPQSADRFRPRISSIPNDMGEGALQSLPLPGGEGEAADVLRLRNFAVTSKGLVNRGDSFRRSQSAHASPASGRRRETDQRQQEKEEQAQAAGARYSVLVVGAPDVGKTALINQFMTSEYICAYDGSQDEEHEKSVGVVVNGAESELVFLEHQYAGEQAEPLWEPPCPDAYLAVYSVTSKRSLAAAREALRRADDAKARILVANKTDLARHRCLSTHEGRSVAVEEGSKFIETSAGINHHVDELLAGLVAQIQLRVGANRPLGRRESVSLAGAKPSPQRRSRGPRGILRRILRKAGARSKSCDDLHVL